MTTPTNEAIENKEVATVEEWIMREQVTKILGISERSVQRYAQAGDLRSELRRRGDGKMEALYLKPDVLALKIKLDNPQPKPSSALVKAQTQAMAPQLPPAPERKRKRLDVRVAEQLIVTVSEASALTKLSEADLRAEIRAGRLVAFERGHGFKITRKDLDRFVKGLSKEARASREAQATVSEPVEA